MPRLPDSMTFLRPFIHRLRISLRQYPLIRALFGQSADQRTDADWLPAIDGMRNQYLNLLDRLAVLESSLNWRLHGLPARIENISLEQLPVLTGTGIVRQALAKLSENAGPPPELIHMVSKNICSEATIFWVEDRNVELGDLLLKRAAKNVFRVVDPFDLFSQPSAHDASGNEHSVVAPLLDAAARFTKPEFDLVWLSSAIERLTPVQIQAFFLSMSKGLSAKGHCFGIFVEFSQSDAGLYWADPRRIRPITTEVIKLYATNAGFNQISFSESKKTDGLVHVLFDISF